MGSRGLLATIVVILLALSNQVDARTGSAPFQHLYYIPIVIAAVGLPPFGGVVTALVAVVLYHAANPRLLTLAYGESDIVQIALFLGIGLVTTKLVKDARRLRSLADTDDLTGLYNLRGFEGRLDQAIAAARDRRAPLALLVLDLDRLKSLNDTHGHLAGADAVRSVGHLIAQHLTGDSFACRFGGDEFVIALPGHPPNQATRVAEALREAVNGLSPTLAGVQFPPHTLSISVGAAACLEVSRLDTNSANAGESLFRAADGSLYEAKSAGRNHVSLKVL